MQSNEPFHLNQIRAFLDASEELGFAGLDRKEKCAWIEQTLVEPEYPRLKRAEKGWCCNVSGKCQDLAGRRSQG